MTYNYLLHTINFQKERIKFNLKRIFKNCLYTSYNKFNQYVKWNTGETQLNIGINTKKIIFLILNI